MAPPRDLRYVDADGHVLEHPTEMPAYAPPRYRDRIWHIETDAGGQEWMVMDDQRIPAESLAIAGTAGMSEEERSRARRGELRYTQVRPAAYDAKARLRDLDAEGIDASVLYPTFLLGLPGHRDVDFAEVQCRAYNDWLSDHVGQGKGRLFGAALLPQQDIGRAGAEIRRAAGLKGIIGVMLRPNPTADWRPFNDRVYDPLWTAACDAGLPVCLHPYLDARLPGACLGLRVNKLRTAGVRTPETDPNGLEIDNVCFTQAIANPFDMMNSMAFLLAGGVCERFPSLRILFLEAGGGWIVPWLERLDHHARVFSWELPSLRLRPSDYFRRQCWISFDPDESSLGFSANSPLCGAERIVWASDYPHPDARFPGGIRELEETLRALTPEQRARIAGRNAVELYAIAGA